jgi:hypothetical protein
MSSLQGIPKGAAIALTDMLDECAKIQAGQEVLILAHIDGLYGGDNLVDREAISWIQQAVQFRGAIPSVLWIDEKAKPHAWRFPPVVKAAVEACDVLISHSLDIEHEEIMEFKQFLWGPNMPILVRNFAATAALLCTPWAQTPYELVSGIRYYASLPFKHELPWKMSDENGTDLEGIINSAHNPQNFNVSKQAVNANAYSRPRAEYRPWPEWMHPPVGISDTNGVFIFDRMLSWWSRYIGLSPYFAKPIRIQIENNKMVKIEGDSEAETLKIFLTAMQERLGNGVYDFNSFHFGVHPQAEVSPHQCPNILHRRIIEHSHCATLHFHLGAPKPTPEYPYWLHCTGDIRQATFRVGDALVYDRGHMTALDMPEVRAIAAKYPGRPGLDPQPKSF